jgi:biopolymer transport protein ExbD
MNFRSRNKVQTGFSMSSMTDLVFLLLIFFIILSTLVSPYALPVDLPVSKNKTKEKQKISVTIKPDLTHYINSSKVSPDNFEKLLKSILMTGEEASLIMHVDQTVPTGVMVKVLDIAKRNKCKIVLATKPK